VLVDPAFAIVEGPKTVPRVYLLAAALFAAPLLAATTVPAAAQFGGGLAPGERGDTQIPFGSTDTGDQGGPALGGMGGSTMKVDKFGRKNWPCYPAGQWAGSKDFHPPKGCKQADPPKQ